MDMYDYPKQSFHTKYLNNFRFFDISKLISAVHCPPIPQRRGLNSSTQSTKMDTHVTFQCENGNALIGASEIICLPSGNWSSPFPICESIIMFGKKFNFLYRHFLGIECGEVGGILPQHLKVSIVSRDVGGRAVFNCPPGFGIRGPQETTCLPSGEWALPFPTCAGTQYVRN